MKLNSKMLFPAKLISFLKQYRYVLIMILAGLILLLIPSKKKTAQVEMSAGLAGDEEDFSVEALEEKLGEILSRVEGAGEVSVVLTVRSGMERILATDHDITDSDDQYREKEQTVTVSVGSNEEVVLITQRYPTFQGALVVCRGGNDPQVQLVLTRALSALTGLSSNRITVCKGS